MVIGLDLCFRYGLHLLGVCESDVVAGVEKSVVEGLPAVPDLHGYLGLFEPIHELLEAFGVATELATSDDPPLVVGHGSVAQPLMNIQSDVHQIFFLPLCMALPTSLKERRTRHAI